MRHIDLIVIHCSATREECRYRLMQLIRDHRERFGFTGYHYYVTREGRVHQTRHEQLVGAHAQGYNQNALGICYEGGLDREGNAKDTRTKQQKAVLWHLLKRLTTAHPDARIVGHCELPGVTKPCPCFLPSQEYAELQPKTH